MSQIGNYTMKLKQSKQFEKDKRKLRRERRRICIKWFWTDFERWVCYQRAKRIIEKDQAFLMIQESKEDEIYIMYKKR